MFFIIVLGFWDGIPSFVHFSSSQKVPEVTARLNEARGATTAPAGVTDDGSVSWPAVPVVLKCSNDDKAARLTLELWETVRPK
jgi:hypothetical protein